VVLFEIRRYHGTRLTGTYRYELLPRWAAGLFAA
jgi:hypothetical protein